MRQLAAVLVLLLLALPVAAVDLGRAEGTLTIDSARIPLTYAYAIDHQKNQLTNRNSDTKIILTDKPLPDGAKLDDVDYNFPEGILGVVICITGKNDDVSHIVVQHSAGTYDGGYFENVPEYKFKRQRAADRNILSGNVTSKKITTNTMTFTIDADFAANVQ